VQYQLAFKHIGVGEAVLAQRLPDVLGGVELGALRWQERHPHIGRHGQLAGHVLAGLAHHHDDELLGMALGDFAE
jgi:hypothetical protein